MLFIYNLIVKENLHYVRKKELDHSAYGGVNGDDYIPFIPASEAMPEATAISIIIGCLFAAANTYLGLKVGMTIAAVYQLLYLELDF